VTVLAQHSLLVKLAEAKENNSCLRIRYPKTATSLPVAAVFYEDHNPAYCLRDVYGSIGEKWMDKGGRTGLLGYALTDETGTPNKPGRYNHFKNGSIYWSPTTGAQEVHGSIRAKWAAMGWENSLLGFPTTDEIRTPTKAGAFNHFQGGSISWSPGTGAHEVHGDIRGLWSRMGWENSQLGFPTSDEYGISGGRRSDFQGGCRIDWFPATGAKAYCNNIPTF
jgi:uncharacterized protein with LGFP repeats